MHFSLFLWHASTHCWKDSSGIPLNFVVISSKRAPLMISLSLGERKMSHSARSGKLGGCSKTVMFLSARNCWIRSTPSPVTFQTCLNLQWLSSKYIQFSCSTELWSFGVNRQSPQTTCLMHLTFIAILLVEGLLLQKSCSPSRDPLWTFYTASKPVCTTGYHLHLLLRHFRCLW